MMPFSFYQTKLHLLLTVNRILFVLDGFPMMCQRIWQVNRFTATNILTFSLINSFVSNSTLTVILK